MLPEISILYACLGTVHLAHRHTDMFGQLKFPAFPQSPQTDDLLPFSEIYHLIRTQPSAKIMALGSSGTDGICIG